jgi:hypothetical protein
MAFETWKRQPKESPIMLGGIEIPGAPFHEKVVIASGSEAIS